MNIKLPRCNAKVHKKVK